MTLTRAQAEAIAELATHSTGGVLLEDRGGSWVRITLLDSDGGEVLSRLLFPNGNFAGKNTLPPRVDPLPPREPT